MVWHVIGVVLPETVAGRPYSGLLLLCVNSAKVLDRRSNQGRMPRKPSGNATIAGIV